MSNLLIMDTQPAIRSLLFERMHNEEIDILQRGEVLPIATRLEDLRGPIRARQKLQSDG